MRTHPLAIKVASGFLILACATTTPPAHAEIPADVLAKVQSTYDPTILESQVQNAPEKLKNCEITKVDFKAKDPHTLLPGKIQLRMYTPSNVHIVTSDMRTILLLPPTGGENKLDLGYATLFCKAHFRVAILEHWDGDATYELDPIMHEGAGLQSLAAVRHAIDYLHPVRPTQLGIMGTSVGAIYSALALGHDSRIATGALIVGGGGMTEIRPRRPRRCRWR